MGVNPQDACQDAMSEPQSSVSEPQLSERNVAPVGGASVATIESLRARLLAERAASKEARQHAHDIAVKVSELQSRLDAEIENRKKAEAEMQEVLEVLKIKGVTIAERMLAAFSLSGSSESEEAARSRSSKDGESEHSSSEDASQEHSENNQDSAIEAWHTEGLELKLEETGCYEGSFSDQRQMGTEGSLRSEIYEMDKDRASEDEEVKCIEQDVVTNALEEHSHASPNQLVEESSSNQPSELPAAFEKHLNGQVDPINDWESGTEATKGKGSPIQSSIKAATSNQEVESNIAPTVNLLGAHHQASEGSSSHVNEVAKLKSVPLDEDATSATESPTGLGHRDVHANDRWHSADANMTRGLTPLDMTPSATENVFGFGHKDMQLRHLPRSGYPYERPYVNGVSLQRMHYAPSAEVPFLRGPMSTGYAVREFLGPDIADNGRHPQAPISDAILSLIDDRNGKLGNILMALNLAKQQINDEGYASSHAEDMYEASSPSPFNGKPYSVSYEGVPYQPPYRSWRHEPHSQAPIIHFPMSPRSDYEPSAFDRHDGSRNGSNSAYYTPSYDPYLQPKGELHLGNGITLYTD